MRNISRIGIFSLFLWLSSAASGVVLTLGTSAQTVTFTGTGVNSSGLGTARTTWGSCTFDGANTTCVVSGPYTGLGNGGTYTFSLVYPGNGPSPLSVVARTPGSNEVFFSSLTSGSFTTTLTPTNGTPVQFYDLTFSFFFVNPTCTGVATCTTASVLTSQGGTITGPVNGSWDTTPIITKGGVVTASSYGGFSAIAPSTWMEIYGLNLATTLSRTWGGSDFNGVQAPTSLGGTTVTVAGKPAFVDFVSPHQVNAQVPSGIPSGQQSVVVTTVGGSSLVFTIVVNPTQPGMLAPAAFKLAAGQYAVALFPDAVTYVLPPGTPAGVPVARAKPGDTITLYGIGFGTVTPNIDAGLIVQQANSLSGFQAFFAGTPARVQFAGLVSGLVGLYQFNVVVPNVAASDAVPFTFSLNGTPGTQQLLLPVGN
jgi:uncharacterized protein (TIGR03437 family)